MKAARPRTPLTIFEDDLVLLLLGTYGTSLKELRPEPHGLTFSSPDFFIPSGVALFRFRSVDSVMARLGRSIKARP